MKSFLEIISKNSNGKKVLLFFILANIVYALMLTITIPDVMDHANGLKLFDMMPTGYDFDYATKLLNTLGEKGRNAYLNNQIPLDMVYPILFIIAYSLLLAFVLKKLGKFNKPMKYLCLLPVIGGVADYAENVGIISLLKSYPAISVSSVRVTNYFSLLKSVSTSLFFISLLIVLILLGIRMLRTSKE